MGTKRGYEVTRDTEDVPLAQVFDHVLPEELQRFENQNYADEDERERIRLLTLKPRGRPRKDPTNPSSSGKLPKGTPGGSAQGQIKSSGYSTFRQLNTDGKPRRGRPLGWRKGGGLPNIPVPSFNGPQPTGARETPAAEETDESEKETPLDVQARTGVYSMVAASGILSRASTGAASRHETPVDDSDQSMETALEEPSPTRQRYSNDPSSEQPDARTRRGSSEFTVEESERQALLEQFATATPNQKPTNKEPTEESPMSTIKVARQARPFDNLETSPPAPPTPKIGMVLTPLKPPTKNPIPPVYRSPGGRIRRTLTPFIPGMNSASDPALRIFEHGDVYAAVIARERQQRKKREREERERIQRARSHGKQKKGVCGGGEDLFHLKSKPR